MPDTNIPQVAPMVVSLGIAIASIGGFPASAQQLPRVEGPVVLHAAIADQWGGHTFNYVVAGQDALFWAATAHRPDKKLPPKALIGQHPKDTRKSSESVKTLTFDDPSIIGINQPQMVRSPDGILHVFIGVTHSTTNPKYNVGRLHYFRSDKPEDVNSLIDRSSLIPKEPFDSFHLRMNVGISQDGRKMVLVILAISEDGRVRFNTPVMFLGQRDGLDYVFKNPIAYAEPMGFFYPQVAATPDGIVLVGQLSRHPEPSITRLVHVDWNGKSIHAEDLPRGAATKGEYLAYDLRPFAPNDWSRLMLYCDAHGEQRHDYWQYETATKKLRLLRSVPCDAGASTPGRWVPLTNDRTAFINNPSSSQLRLWQGDLTGQGPVNSSLLPQTHPIDRGFQANAYLFSPNPLQGSILVSGETIVATDAYSPNRSNVTSGPCSFLMWKLIW